ncbi:hypothetical protein YenMTG1_204 [Yersinia phage vB_YenM_TG1]|uniref:Uncharacterized protein n=1 Tax=Yersinia phage vB_YenM_TG1 TaxID=1589265 RepID=A0A0B5A2P0_9CAUD|nr:hypothetical protein AVV33_gp191 [Yersinia phage vB_YenM_TG1]AJD82014.1 hypothetical protein YenMTG1_204 [Yersinia phage vB_YenM_TG1]
MEKIYRWKDEAAIEYFKEKFPAQANLWEEHVGFGNFEVTKEDLSGNILGICTDIGNFEANSSLFKMCWCLFLVKDIEKLFVDITYLYQHLVSVKEIDEKEPETASEYKYVVVGFLRNGTKYTGRIKNTLEKAEEEASNLSFSNPESVYFVSKLQTQYQYKLNKTEV